MSLTGVRVPINGHEILSRSIVQESSTRRVSIHPFTLKPFVSAFDPDIKHIIIYSIVTRLRDSVQTLRDQAQDRSLHYNALITDVLAASTVNC